MYNYSINYVLVSISFVVYLCLQPFVLPGVERGRNRKFGLIVITTSAHPGNTESQGIQETHSEQKFLRNTTIVITTSANPGNTESPSTRETHSEEKFLETQQL